MSNSENPNDLRILLEEYVAAHPKKTGERAIWRKPLLASAKADDRFDILPRIAAEDHLLPRDLLASAKSVVVFFIPFIKELAVENHKGEFPCRGWGLAYESTNRLINSACEHIRDDLEKRGGKVALTPATHNFDPARLVARWSHKHLGYLSGLGRFGVNAQFITPAGCAGRMGSLVTDAEFGDSPLVGEKELCLHKNGHKCLVCVKRCPVGAVSESGIDRKRCWDRLNSNIAGVEALAGLENSTHVCGKCQVLAPCSLKAPGKKECFQ
ncbi:MAG: epoxyqueuosine reductase [Desulfobacterales bacterium]|nr:epoxyqueuosine reductase [Desulfobacterales bacterium]